MFELQQVGFGQVLNLDHLTIPAGKTTCIVGASGSGKSTLLRLLNKLHSPTSGRILWQGNDIASLNSVTLRRQVVMLAQNPVTFAGDLRANLQQGRVFAQLPLASDAELRAALELVNLDKELDAPLGKFSGGELQRMALARVILMQPQVYLLDEPTAALDAGNEVAIIGRLIDYARSHDATVIMVTHSQLLVEQFAEYLVELEQGHIVAAREHLLQASASTTTTNEEQA